MRYLKERMICLFAVSLLLPLWPAGDADAQFNGALRGDYNLDVTRYCVVANPPQTFSPTDFSLVGAGSTGVIEPIGVTGTLHFNGDGTGNSRVQTMNVFSAGGRQFPPRTVEPDLQRDVHRQP